jgi:hypothetical protein
MSGEKEVRTQTPQGGPKYPGVYPREERPKTPEPKPEKK